MKVELTGEEYQELIDKYNNLCELIIEKTNSKYHSFAHDGDIIEVIIPVSELPEIIIKKISK